MKEKIFVDTDENNWMSGILIYTASTSSDGSLGGVVRLGKRERIKKLIKSALNQALWCSNDPICLESKSQGFNSMNYAACHACVLVPETSCINNNILLDRGAVVGDYENRNRGFWGTFIENNSEYE